MERIGLDARARISAESGGIGNGWTTSMVRSMMQEFHSKNSLLQGDGGAQHDNFLNRRLPANPSSSSN